MKLPIYHFKIPLIVFAGIVLYSLLFFVFHETVASRLIIIAATLLGSYQLVNESIISILKKQFALDYIAIVAIVIALITGQYLVAGILALMLSTGRTLEEYGASQAQRSLTALAKRIPNEIVLWKNNVPGERAKIQNVKVGEKIYVRKGEVIPLDGMLLSDEATTDESSLTGEPYFIDKLKGDQMRSGTVNLGNPIVIKVTKTQENSTYTKIIKMVEAAQDEKSPLVRLADKYSTVFTIITFAIAAFAYALSGFDLTRVLAVLAVATPCPLIIATPIALLGGVNASAKKRIIVKRLASLEVLSRITTLIFDKTGTITIGYPLLKSLTLKTKNYSQKEILGIAAAIERSSLHPLAKAIVLYAKQHNAPILYATHITEQIGHGIRGTINGKRYTLSKVQQDVGMTIELLEEDLPAGRQGKQIALFSFEDEIKKDSKEIINQLKNLKIELYIFTGDKKESARTIAEQLGNVAIRAEQSPKDKQERVKELKHIGKTVAMVGDGINDAPALALADVGMVFSNEEQTAASEAADIVFLGGNFSQVLDSYFISKRTIGIALQSILWGIGLSIVGMVFASVGLLPPLFGAGLQEAIDVAVILNALRASRS